MRKLVKIAKRHLALLLAMVMLFSCFLAEGIIFVSAEEELVHNGDFESGEIGGNPHYWMPLSLDNGTGTALLASDATRGGKVAEVVANGMYAVATMDTYGIIEVEGGATYNFTYWVKTVGGEVSSVPYIRQHNESMGNTANAFLALTEHRVSGAADWQKIEATFTADPDAKYVYLWLTVTNGTAYFDDVSFTKKKQVEIVDKGMIFNSGFERTESGALVGFSGFGADGTGAGSFAQAPNQAFAGESAVAITATAGSYIFHVAEGHEIAVEPSTNYRITYMVRIESSAASIHPMVRQHAQGGGNSSTAPFWSGGDYTVSGATNGWKQVTVDFTTDDNTAYVYPWLVVSGGSVYVDEWIMYKTIAAADDGLLQNGSFENTMSTGDAQFWMPITIGDNSTGTITIEHDVDRGGRVAQIVTGDGASYGIATMDGYSVDVSPSTNYILSYWVKQEGAEVSSVPYIRQHNAAGGNASTNPYYCLADYRVTGETNGWTQVTANFTTDADCESAYIWLAASKGTVSFDDVSLVVKPAMVDEAVTGMVANGNFADGVTGWQDCGIFGGTGSKEVVEDLDRLSHVMKITPADGFFGTGTLEADGYYIAVQPNTEYTFSYWLKQVGASASSKVMMRQRTATGDADGAYAQPTNFVREGDTNGWVKVEEKFTTGADATRLTFMFAGQGGTFYIDDVALVAKPAMVDEAVTGMVANGNFADGVTGWQDCGIFGGTGSKEVVEDLDRLSHVMKITPADGFFGTGTLEADGYYIAVQPNTEYTFSYWLKQVGASASSKVMMRQRTATGDADGAYAQPTNFVREGDTNGWVKVEENFITGADATRLTFMFAGQGGTFYIDDVALVDNTPLVPSSPFDGGLVTNGGFEDGKPGVIPYYWMDLTIDLGTGTVTADVDNDRGLIAKVTHTSEDGGYAISTMDGYGIAVEPNTTYAFSYWVKQEGDADVYTQPFMRQLTAENGNAVNPYYGLTDFRLTGATNGWQKVEGTYTSSSDCEKVYIWLSVRGGTAWFDNVSLTKVTYVEPEDNMIFNGGFERHSNGNLVGFSMFGVGNNDGTAGEGSFSLATDEKYDGNSSVKLHPTKDSVAFHTSDSYRVDVKPNTTYKITYWLKTTSEDCTVYPYIRQHKADGSNTINNTYLPRNNYTVSGLTNGWKQVTAMFTSESDAGYIYVWLLASGGDVYVDNLIMQETAPISPEDTLGFDIDDGGMPPYGWIKNDNGNMQNYQYDLVDGVDGKALRITKIAGGSEGISLAISSAVPVQPSTNYVLTFWVKAGGEGINNYVFFHQTSDTGEANNAWLWPSSNYWVGARDWKKISVPFRTSDNATATDIRLACAGAEGSWIVYDSLELIKLSNDTNLDFEMTNADGSPTNWFYNTSSDVEAEMKIDSTDSYTGQNSLYIKRNSSKASFSVENGGYVAVTAGDYYELSYWVKSKNAVNATAKLSLVVYNNDDVAVTTLTTVDAQLSGASTTSSEWKQYKMKLIVPSGGVKGKFFIDVSMGRAELWVDHITLRRVQDTSTTVAYWDNFAMPSRNGNVVGWTGKNVGYVDSELGQLVTNHDFEDGEAWTHVGYGVFPQNWQASSALITGEGTADVVLDAEHGHVAKLTAQDGTYGMATKDAYYLDVEPDTTYTLSYWVKQEGARVYHTPWIRQSPDQSTATTEYNAYLSLTGYRVYGPTDGWQKVEATFTTEGDCEFVHIWLGVTNGTACFDDVQLMQTDGNVAGRDGAAVLTGKAQMTARLTGLRSNYVYKLQAEISEATVSQATVKVKYLDHNYNEIAGTAFAQKATIDEAGMLSLFFTAPSCTVAEMTIETESGKMVIDELEVQVADIPVSGSNWQGQWIWYTENASISAVRVPRYFRTSFEITEQVTQAVIQMTCDDKFELYINGEFVDSETSDVEDTWKKPHVLDIAKYLKPGKNTLAFSAYNVVSQAGLLFDARVDLANGVRMIVASNGDVKCSNKLEEGWTEIDHDDSKWEKSMVLGAVPVNPWAYIQFDNSYFVDASVEIVDAGTVERDSEAGEYTDVEITMKLNRPITTNPEFNVNIWKRNSMVRVTSSKLELIDGSNPQAWPVGEEFTAKFRMMVPKFIDEGRYTLQLDQDTFLITNEFMYDNKFMDFRVVRSVALDHIKSEVKDYNGEPTLFIDGVPRNHLAALLSVDTGRFVNADQFAEQGDLDMYLSFHNALEDWWERDGSINYDAFDTKVLDVLNENPNGMIMISISCNAPTWWQELNPDELQVRNDGTVQGVSLSSEKYREDVAKVLKDVLSYARTKSYFSRVYGIRLTGFQTGEWLFYPSSLQGAIDFSPAAEKGFRKWLTEKYGTDAKLQEAWKNNEVTLKTATVPTYEERTTTEYISVLDPATQKNILDFQDYQGWAMAETFLSVCTAAKEATDDQLIVGGYHGYVWNAYSHEGNDISSTNIQRVLESDMVDFICAPQNYNERDLEKSGATMTMTDSVKAHNKLFLQEQDNRTSIGTTIGLPDQDSGVGKTYTMEETINQLKRDYAQILTESMGGWFYDMDGGWFDDTQMYNLMAQMKAEGDFAVFNERKTTSDIGVFISEKTYHYSPYSFGAAYQVYHYLYLMQRFNLGTFGANYDSYVISDLVKGLVDTDYKVNLILSPYQLTEAERKAIDEQLKKDGKIVVWVFATGISDTNTNSVENIEQLTEMDMTMQIGKPIRANVTVTNGTHDYTKGLKGASFGTANAEVGPYITVTDSAATALGHYENGDVGLAVKDMGDWTSVYSAAPNIPNAMLQNLVKAANGHIYSDVLGDVVYSNNHYVSVHNAYAGDRVIKLPQNHSVYDVYEGEFVSMDTDSFKVSLKENETKMYRLMSPNMYAVLVKHNGHGAVTNFGVTEVKPGADMKVKITPDTGYKIASITVDGEEVKVANSLSLSDIQDNVTVDVVFEKMVVKTDEPIQPDEPVEEDPVEDEEDPITDDEEESTTDDDEPADEEDPLEDDDEPAKKKYKKKVITRRIVGLPWWAILLIVVGGVLVAGGATWWIIILIKKKKKKEEEEVPAETPANE